MALSIIESRAINNRISTNLDTLNSGNLLILQSRSINQSIDEDMALLNWDKFDREQSNRHGLEPDGKDNEVKTAKGTKIVTGFMVIEASKLIVSHDEQGNANPDYPQEMQPRDRARDTSQAQIARIAKNLDPDMLGRTRVVYQGAPIIGKDGVVESGNGRAMAITLAYKLGKADEYRAWLLDIADMYGLNPDKIEHMKCPVLVRVRKTDVDRAQFAIEANQSDMLAMTATEKAKSDAARLTDAIISKLSIEGDLTAASNRDFIMAFLQSLGDDETAGLLTTSGQPTKQLYDRAQAAVFAKAYNDDRLLELMADAEKPEIANIIKSLNQAAQPFITARNISEHATHATTQKIGDAIDVSLDQQAVDAIVKATEMLKKAKDSGMPIEELIKQSDLFGGVDPVVAQMALFIKENNRSPARMGAAFVAMAEFVVKELESRQNASLFEDDAPIDMVDVLKATNAQLQKQYGEDVKAIGGTGGFIDMFTETRGQKADREAFLAREAANEDQQADPVATANINASSVSDAIKQKAIKYLQENPASHEIPVIAKKSMTAIMENIKTALFSEIKALSPLFVNGEEGRGDLLRIDAADRSYLNIQILNDNAAITGCKLSFNVMDERTGLNNKLFDFTSTIEELRQWGFALPFDLDVKTFVANVIKPVVDEFLSKKMIENEPETENEPVPVPSDSDETVTPASEDSNEVDNQTEEQGSETKAVEDLVPKITGNTEIDRQKSKLLGLQNLQERMKAVNKIVNNKKLTSEQKKSALTDAGYTGNIVMVDAAPRWSNGKLGYESYELSNNNANIVSTKKRIAQLEAQDLAAAKASSGDSETSFDFEGGTIELDYSADRLKVDFDTKPDSDMISKMKQNGFKWSPSSSVWQRQLTDNAISTANYLFGTKIKTAATMMTEEENAPRPNPIVPAVEVGELVDPIKAAFEIELKELESATDEHLLDKQLDDVMERIGLVSSLEISTSINNQAPSVYSVLLTKSSSSEGFGKVKYCPSHHSSIAS